MKTFQQHREDVLQSAIKNATYGAQLCQCLMFIHELTPAMFVATENPEQLGLTALYSVDPKGIVRDYITEKTAV